MDDDRDLPLVADELGHFIGGGARGSDVVGSRRCNRNVAVHTRVKANNRDIGSLCLLELWNHGFAVERRDPDSLRFLV